MSPRKLILWLFACTLIVCALRAGLLTSADQYIYHLRNMHASTFAYRYDDFLPYLPIVVMFILKLAGVKSRSNWKRMLVSTAFAYVLMGAVVIIGGCSPSRRFGFSFLPFRPYGYCFYGCYSFI